MTDTDRIRAVGELLWGSIWQTEMARALGHKGTRTVRFWAADDRPVPPGVWDDLRAVCAARHADVDQALALVAGVTSSAPSARPTR